MYIHVLCVGWDLNHQIYSPCFPLCTEDVNRRKFLAQARMPRPGYVTVQSSVGQLASDQSSREQAWARVTPTGPQDSPIGPVYTAQPMVYILYTNV